VARSVANVVNYRRTACPGLGGTIVSEIITIFGVYDLIETLLVSIICGHIVVVNLTMRKVLKEILEIKKIRLKEAK
jgi:hypothetical protein